MKRVYSKFSKTRNKISHLLSFLEQVQKKEIEADDLEKKLVLSLENQSNDISEMSKAIKKDLNGYNKDLKSYKEDLKLLRNIKIHSALVQNGKKTLGDYVSENEIEESKENLDSRKQVLITKMEKLNQNSLTLNDAFQGLNQNLGENRNQKSINFKLLENTYKSLKEIGQEAGLTLFDSNPDLLRKADYEWNQTKESDK